MSYSISTGSIAEVRLQKKTIDKEDDDYIEVLGKKVKIKDLKR